MYSNHHKKKIKNFLNFFIDVLTFFDIIYYREVDNAMRQHTYIFCLLLLNSFYQGEWSIDSC